jgi:H+-translocating NAD(P) transhydrogenase subunit alpha
MKVSVLRETRPGEGRVALVPGNLKELKAAGIEVVVERGAGAGAGHSDDEYKQGGAEIAADAKSAMAGATVVVKVQAPTDEEVAALPENAILISLLNPLAGADLAKKLSARKLTTFALELIPRSTRAQSMDVLSSQATVAGYKAVLYGASEMSKLLPMMTTAAGTIKPGKVLVLGAGVAGLQAIATARRLGAKIFAFDVRPAVKEQCQSLGATFLEAPAGVTAEGEGGYAKELSEDQHKRELELIAKAIADTDLVITTAQIPGRKAPILITAEMVRSMKTGSVIMDLAAETGGNCELTQAGKTVVENGVKIVGALNIAAEMPIHASQMFGKNVATFLKELVKDGQLNLDMANDVIGPTCFTHEGNVHNQWVAERIGLAAPAEKVPAGAAS